MARRPDSIDRQLLDLLERDARLPLKALGAQVGLSTSAVQERLARLRSGGEILGFTIRRPAAADALRAYIHITTDIAACSRLAPRIGELPEVRLLDSITGKPDMIVLVEVSGPARLQEVRDWIAGLDHVIGVECMAVMTRRIDRMA